jgi:hypothetical protein
MLKDDNLKAPEIRTATLLIPVSRNGQPTVTVSVHQAHA